MHGENNQLHFYREDLHIGINGTERVVGGFRVHGTRQQIGERRLADVGQTNESHGERVFDATEPSGTHGAEIIVTGILFGFWRHCNTLVGVYCRVDNSNNNEMFLALAMIVDATATGLLLSTTMDDGNRIQRNDPHDHSNEAMRDEGRSVRSGKKASVCLP
jgi:hypothetical protein